MYKSLSSIALTFLFAVQVNAQLVIDAAPSPTQLVQNVLLGGGVTASNITYSGTADGRASFTATGSNLGLTGGVVLSTGIAADAADAGIGFASYNIR